MKYILSVFVIFTLSYVTLSLWQMQSGTDTSLETPRPRPTDTGEYGYLDHLKDIETNPDLPLTQDICDANNRIYMTSLDQFSRESYECYEALAKTSLNPAYCNKLSQFQKEKCINRIAINKKNVKICDRFAGTPQKAEECKLHFFSKTNTFDCLHLKNKAIRYKCYNEARRAEWKSFEETNRQLRHATYSIQDPFDENTLTRLIGECKYFRFKDARNFKDCISSISEDIESQFMRRDRLPQDGKPDFCNFKSIYGDVDALTFCDSRHYEFLPYREKLVNLCYETQSSSIWRYCLNSHSVRTILNDLYDNEKFIHNSLYSRVNDLQQKILKAVETSSMKQEIFCEKIGINLTCSPNLYIGKKGKERFLRAVWEEYCTPYPEYKDTECYYKLLDKKRNMP